MTAPQRLITPRPVTHQRTYTLLLGSSPLPQPPAPPPSLLRPAGIKDTRCQIEPHIGVMPAVGQFVFVDKI
ncbi:hypothetical protein ZWY2020_030365 [Hordeum vulgare]|nr:hypothetical protein ZWY2020_030365 [Hordeum vulgare]